MDRKEFRVIIAGGRNFGNYMPKNGGMKSDFSSGLGRVREIRRLYPKRTEGKECGCSCCFLGWEALWNRAYD